VNKYSHALFFIWHLAELEASHAKFREIHSGYFFLAMLKASDLDLQSALRKSSNLSPQERKNIEKEIEELKQLFDGCSLDAVTVRRRLRYLLGNKSEPKVERKPKSLPRSTSLYDLLQQAKRDNKGRPVTPLRLLPLLLVCSDCKDSLDQALEICNCSCQILGEKAKGALDKATELEDIEGMSRNLTDLAHKGKLAPVYGRKKEILALAQVLIQKRKNNVILCGEAGVGKTVIVEGLANRIAEGSVPSEFRDIRLIEISLPQMVAGTTYRGDFEEKMERLIEQGEADPNLVLFIDEIHLLMGAGEGSSNLDAANILKPALARGSLKVIGATTTSEYRKFIAKDPAIERRFQVLRVDEPDRESSLEILRSIREDLQEHHRVKIADSALTAAVDLSIKYQLERRLPDKAIDLLDQTCAEARLRTFSADLQAQIGRLPEINDKDIAVCLGSKLGIPSSTLVMGKNGIIPNAESLLSQKVIGQPQAISAVCQTLKLSNLGLTPAHKPKGVFLFAGTSGSGKTELAKAIANIYFADRLIRFDMSEFMEEHSVSKLIGSPPGYRDHDQGGQLTEKIRSNPHSVVLLDEVEKAHPRVLNLFLQIFDEGQVCDAQGHRCLFNQSLVILTSNLGANIAPPVGFVAQKAAQEYLENNIIESTKKHFPAELLNRMNAIIPFLPLSEESILAIVDLEISKLNQQLHSMGTSIHLDDSAKKRLAQLGYSKTYGVRALSRTIQQQITQPVTELILSNQPSKIIRISTLNGNFAYEAT